MPRSLFARLLVLSLTVAVAAVGATAWLTTRTTSERIVGEFDRRLEADAFVYTRLLDHASSTPDWGDVEPLVRELARRTGQRIALTIDDGRRLVDTAASPTDATPALPEVPAALIDPFDPLQAVAGDGVSADEALPLVPSVVLDTPQVRAERAALLDESRGCLRAAGIDMSPQEYVELAADLPDDAQAPLPEGCNPWAAVTAPTPTQLALTTELEERTSACLTDLGAADELIAGVQAMVRSPGTSPLVQGVGPPLLEPMPRGDPPDDTAPGEASSPRAADALVDELEDPGVRQCIVSAYRAVYEPYVAEPALLWIGDGTDGGLLARAGGSRLVGALGAVLAVAVGVTVLAGRRLVAPVRALTHAADRMGAGERSARVDVRGKDDVARLGTAFNRMAASVELGERQRRAMVSDIAHELRTPLTTLRGQLEGVQDGVLDVDGDIIDSLHDEAVLLQRLVDDLQELALADAGRLQVHPEPFDAANLAAHVANAHRARATEAGVELVVVADGPVPVVADHHRLRQALGNLVDNALTYTPAGGRVQVLAREEGDTAVLEVSDSGIGIAPDDLDHVFDRFYRADPSRSRRTGGSGLGLAITRSLVEAHGGTVTATSTPSDGATFRIEVPKGDA